MALGIRYLQQQTATIVRHVAAASSLVLATRTTAVSSKPDQLHWREMPFTSLAHNARESSGAPKTTLTLSIWLCLPLSWRNSIIRNDGYLSRFKVQGVCVCVEVGLAHLCGSQCCMCVCALWCICIHDVLLAAHDHLRCASIEVLAKS